MQEEAPYLPSLRRFRPGGLVLAASLSVALLAMYVAAFAQAQVGPSISYEMSPAQSVALDTDIIATITLDGLDSTTYSSVIFRADLTQQATRSTTMETRRNGDDTGKDIEIGVDSTT